MNRRGSLVALLAAETVSVLGSRMTMVALPWLVLVTTGSAACTGLVAAAESLPYVLASALGAPLVDRIGGRRVSVAADLASAGAVAAVPLLLGAGLLPFAALLGVVAVAGGLRGFGDGAKSGAMFPQAVARSGMAMTRAVALRDGLSRATSLLGAPLAGVLVVWLGGADRVLLVDAVSFLVCGLLVLLLVRVAGRPGDADPPEPYRSALRAGLSFVAADRLVLGLMLMLFMTNMLDQAYGSVLVPLWAREVFGSPVGIGLVSASFAVGAVVGNLGYTALAPRLPRWGLYAAGFVVAGAPRFAVLAFDAPVWLIVVNGVAGGLAIAAVNPILGAVFYERVPQRLTARVQGAATAVAFAGMPLGALLGGWLGGYGVRVALIVTGSAYLLTTLAPLAGRVWREMDRGGGAVASGVSDSHVPVAAEVGAVPTSG